MIGNSQTRTFFAVKKECKSTIPHCQPLWKSLASTRNLPNYRLTDRLIDLMYLGSLILWFDRVTQRLRPGRSFKRLPVRLIDPAFIELLLDTVTQIANWIWLIARWLVQSNHQSIHFIVTSHTVSSHHQHHHSSIQIHVILLDCLIARSIRPSNIHSTIESKSIHIYHGIHGHGYDDWCFGHHTQKHSTLLHIAS